ncbi:MAG: tetratricopeptide repeat protein [Candidatus Thorarchaeota archaeon]
MDIPPEFEHFADDPAIPWEDILREAERRTDGKSAYVALTDMAIELASHESMKKNPNKSLLALGVEAALIRGRLTDVLFLAAESQDPRVLGLKAIALFALSDVDGLRHILKTLESTVTDDSPVADRIRMSTVRVLLAAAERDTSVIMCVMEFDNLLEEYPEQVENPLTETMFTLYVVGTMLREIGEASRASRIADTLDEMARAKGHRMTQAMVENLRGNICHLVGDIRGAEEHYLKLREMSEELAFELGKGMALNNLGSTRLYEFRLEEALEYIQQATEYLDGDAPKLVAYTNLGEIATLLGRYEEAEQYFREAVRLDKKTKRGLVEAYTMYCGLLCRQGRLKEAKEHLETARRIAESSEKPIQRCAYLHAKGLFAAARGDFEGAIKAFEEGLALAREKSVFEMLIRAELELARIYIGAYETTRDLRKISQAMYHLDDLAQIAKEQGMHSLRAHVLLLKSDLLRLVGRLFEARGYAERALSIARFTDDSALEQEVQAKLEVIAKSQKSGRIPSDSEVGESIDRMSAFRPLRSLRETPTPALHALIAIDRGTGLTEFVHYFDRTLEMDSSIVAGFISAIGAFSAQLMGSTGNLRTIAHEGFTLMMEHTERRTVALIATAETFELRYRLREFAKQFDLRFPQSIDEDGVDSSKYDGAYTLVEEVFSDILNGA